MARRRGPQLGEHSEQVLRDAGFSDAEIAELVDSS
jgi:crotonobetainyl-CoA:carnitine CoA-transferase CaiB-like acyl-CoA transferase